MKNIYLMNKEYQIECVLNNDLPKSLPVIEDTLVRSLDDYTNQVTIKVPLSHPRSRNIENEKLFYYPVDYGYKLYKIIEVEELRENVSTITAVGELEAYSELIDEVVRPTIFNSTPFNDIVKYVLQDTPWELGDGDEYPNMDYEITDYSSVLEVLRTLAELVGAELDFEYVMNRNIITDKKLHFYKSYNDAIGKIVLKQRDLISLKRTVDTRELCTAMIGVGGVVGDKPINLSNLQVTPPAGFIKEFGSDFIYNKEAFNNYNRNGKHRIGIYNNSEAKSDYELYNLTLEALKEAMKPQVKYEVNMAFLKGKLGMSSDLSLGNTIYVNDMTEEPYIALQARIRAKETSESQPHNNSVTLGNYKTITVTEKDNIKQIQNKIEQTEKEWNKAKWSVKITSTNGTTLRPDLKNTTLTIRVYKSGDEYDPFGTELSYVWRRYDQYGQQINISENVWQLEQKELVVYYETDGGVAIYEGVAGIPLSATI